MIFISCRMKDTYSGSFIPGFYVSKELPVAFHFDTVALLIFPPALVRLVRIKSVFHQYQISVRRISKTHLIRIKRRKAGSFCCKGLRQSSKGAMIKQLVSGESERATPMTKMKDKSLKDRQAK